MNYVIIAILMLFSACSNFESTTDIMTYNLRYDNPKDGENSWSNRKEFLLSQINYYAPDIFGTQEGMEHQVKWLDEKLESYNFVGVGRDEDLGGEYSALFFDKTKFTLIKSSTFWLSPTPAKPSIGWDAALNRICTYALLKSISEGNIFWVFNLHLDHKGKIARAKSVDLVLEQIDNLNSENHPVILMGDFNLKPEESPIIEIGKHLNDSKFVSVQEPFGPDETACGFDISLPNQHRIDYIFTSKGNIVVNKYAVIANIENMKYPSDHFPVLCNITINGN